MFNHVTKENTKNTCTNTFTKIIGGPQKKFPKFEYFEIF